MRRSREDDDTIGLEEAAELLHVHRHTLRRAYKLGQIPGLRISQRLYVFSKSRLLELVRSGKPA